MQLPKIKQQVTMENTEMNKTLTANQKLRAIHSKYYDHLKWEPKLHDYYCLTRSTLGLELFQITHETETQWGIMKVWDDMGGYQEEPTYFDKQGFSTEGFGEYRVWIPEYIFSI